MSLKKQDNEPEFVDADDISFFGGENKFNHQMLVMLAYKKVIDAAAHEMRSGWFNSKTDAAGNTTMTYIEDTRKKFIEAVKGLELVLWCDFDEEAEKIVTDIKEKLAKDKKELLEAQWGWYDELDPDKKKAALKQYGQIYKMAFHTELAWYQTYLEKELEYYRLIAKELSRLTKRKKFYEKATRSE